jgi:N-acetylmuramoyl-L-alanine amidase
VTQEIPDVEVVFTRTSDIYQHPATKANIANQAKGDLFISIHCNSAAPIRHREFTGYKTQTYYTGKGKSRNLDFPQPGQGHRNLYLGSA